MFILTDQKVPIHALHFLSRSRCEKGIYPAKAKRSGFSEPTLQRQNLKKIYVTSNHICVSETIQTVWLTESSQKLNLQTESRHLSKNHEKQHRAQSGLMPFVTQYNPSVPNLKNILMSEWNLIENQPLLRETYREPSFISYRKGKSLKDMLVRAKL